MKIKILSSIPGRIRMKIDGLLYNENAMYFLKESLAFYHGIILVSPNSVTGNMIVYYDAKLVDTLQVLDRITSTSIHNIPLYVHKECANEVCKSNFVHKYPIKIYNNEFAISRRLLTISVITSGLTLCVSFNWSLILSLMVFGFPGILLLIRRATYRIAQKNFKYNEFDFKDPNLVYELSEVEHLLIEDSILNSEAYMGSPKEFTGLPYDNALNLIKNFRNLGLIDISMVSRKNNDINSYISYMLGINKIELDSHLPHDRSFLKSLYNKDKTAAIIKSNDLRALRNEHIIVFLGYKKLRPEDHDFVITFSLDGVNKIPCVIETSKYCNKLAIRSENIAVTVNTIGIFLTVSKFITPLWSITIYFINYLANIIYLNTKLSQYEKEHLNEI